MASLETRIHEAVHARRAAIVATLQEWVRVPTQNPPGEGYVDLVNRIVPRFAALGFDVERVDLPPDIFEQRSRIHYPELTGPRPNVLARRVRPGRPGMLWYCHLDTVPIGDPAAWSIPPLDGLVRDGRVWGRGTADAKGAALAVLAAFEVLHDLAVEPTVSPVVALTTDEETGPYTGLMYFADQGVFRECRWFHSLDGPARAIGVANAGAFTWTIRVRGRSVHSGFSMLGVNPIEHSAALLDELLALKRDVQSRVSAIPVNPTVAERGGGTQLRGLLNVNMAHGGFKHNIVPPEFVLEGDRRFLPEEDEETTVAELRAAVERARGRDPELDVELRVRPFYTSYALPVDHPWPLQLQRIAEHVTGHEHPIIGSNGSSDVAHVARVTGIPTVKLGVNRPGETNHHGVDEHVHIDDVLNLVEIVCTLATRECA